MMGLSVLLAFLCGAATPAVAAPATASPTVRMCTKMDCEDRLTISLRAPHGRPSKGLAIELDIDGKPVICAAPVGAAGESRQCDAQVTVIQQEIQRCRAAGCQGTGAFEELITIAATPRRVRVRLKQDQRLLAEKLFVPHFTRVRPNGPGCPPVCRQARRIWQYR